METLLVRPPPGFSVWARTWSDAQCAPPPKLDWQQVNHAVLLVGYGREKPAEEGGAEVPYWILANTWGGGWGEGGFFRVMRGVDEAAVESLAVAVDPRV